MNTHYDKTTETKSNAVANSIGVQQSAEHEETFQSQDTRPEAIAQRKIQDAAKNSTQVNQLKAIQALVNSSRQVKQLWVVQAMANNSTYDNTQLKEEKTVSDKFKPVQRKEQALADPGENKTGLPGNLKSGVEHLSGYSLDDVKVHYNSDKPAQLNALAYAQGTDIHVASGQERHLPHEAWHVVQQKQGRVRPTMQMRSDIETLSAISLENPVIQRTVTQILPGTDNKIGKLLIVGRPERVFGSSMGDHTTAFATHVEAIKLRMENKTLWEALTGLRVMYAMAQKLPGYLMKDNLPSTDIITFGNAKPHGNRFKEADEGLKKLLDGLPASEVNAIKADQTEFALKLQECVNAYLEFRELIPLSAVNVMAIAPGVAGKGKGESGYASILAENEKSGGYEKDMLQRAVLGVFDLNAAAMVVATTDPGTLAKIAPGLDPKLLPDKMVEFLATQHLQSIKDGFPKSFDKVAISEKVLGELIIKGAKAEMEKNREILALRYARRIEKYNVINKEILSGINNTKYYRDIRDDLSIECKSLQTQIERLNVLLKSEITVPKNTLDIGKSEEHEKEQQNQETGKAKEREEELVEEEERKQPIATQILLRRYVALGGKPQIEIEKIEIAGRPPSPISGSMGAHSTAWVVHTDRIQKALKGQTLVSALDIMNQVLVTEATNLESTLAKANPPRVKGQKELAQKAKDSVLERKKKKANEYGSPSELAFTLQQYINELLIYINYIPGVTRESVDTTGHGEGKHRKVLIEYEEWATIQQNKINSKFKKENPRTSTKQKGPKQKASPPKFVPSKKKYEEVKDAVYGLLDLKNLNSKNIFVEAHLELIKKTYPSSWSALKTYGFR